MKRQKQASDSKGFNSMEINRAGEIYRQRRHTSAPWNRRPQVADDQGV